MFKFIFPRVFYVFGTKNLQNIDSFFDFFLSVYHNVHSAHGPKSVYSGGAKNFLRAQVPPFNIFSFLTPAAKARALPWASPAARSRSGELLVAVQELREEGDALPDLRNIDEAPNWVSL